MSRRVAARDNSRYGAAATAAPVLTASARPRRRRVKVFAQAFFKRLVGVRGRRPCGLSRLRQTQEGRKGFLRKAFRRGLRFRSGRSWARATGTQDPLQPRDRRAPPYNPQLLKKLAKLLLVSTQLAWRDPPLRNARRRLVLSGHGPQARAFGPAALRKPRRPKAPFAT